MQPGSRDEEIQRSWEANADAWSTAIREERLPSRSVTSPAVLEMILRCNPTSVLDVGCGEGWLIRALTQRGIDALGVDGSEELIERARWAGHGRYRVATYQDLIAEEPGEAPYDVIVCNFSLFDRDLAPLFRALRSMLTDNGSLVIQTLHPYTSLQGEPYQSGWRLETFASLGAGFTEPMPWYARTMEDWWLELDEAGLRIAQLREPRSPEGTLLSMILVATPVVGE
jgi:2-polyprenyl-3-methyl-5-hydroxy-6-metoxy-1,4-benzoquinol methylase